MWPFKKKPAAQPAPPAFDVDAYLAQERRAEAAGKALGRHYTEWVEPVKELKRQGNLAEAERVLLACVEAVERESTVRGWPGAPWYYDQLAIVFRKQGRYDDEVAILERHVRWPHNPAGHSWPLLERLEKARQLQSRQQQNAAAQHDSPPRK
jgi:hypothetical protein